MTITDHYYVFEFVTYKAIQHALLTCSAHHQSTLPRTLSPKDSRTQDVPQVPQSRIPLGFVTYDMLQPQTLTSFSHATTELAWEGRMVLDLAQDQPLVPCEIQRMS